MKRFRISILVIALIIPSIMLAGCGLGKQSNPTILLGSCNLDLIKGGVRDAVGNYSIPLSTPEMVAQGWIANDQAGESPEEVTVSISNAVGEIFGFESGSTKDRPDVAAFFKKPGMENSGFEILIQNVERPGTYTVTLQGKYKSGSILCPRTFTLLVS